MRKTLIIIAILMAATLPCFLFASDLSSGKPSVKSELIQNSFPSKSTIYNFDCVEISQFSPLNLQNFALPKMQPIDFQEKIILDNLLEISDPSALDNGKLLSVEDAGYPILILTVEVSKDNPKVYELNLEESTTKGLTETILTGWIGKKVSVTYTSVTENALLALRSNGEAILDESYFVQNAETQKISGKLSAPEVSNGDLPDEAVITTDKGVKYIFPYFITEEMVSYNGKKVTAYFETRTSNQASTIKLSGNTPPKSGGKGTTRDGK